MTTTWQYWKFWAGYGLGALLALVSTGNHREAVVVGIIGVLFMVGAFAIDHVRWER